MLPEIVKQAEDGSKHVAYMELVPILIEAMKEQQKIVSELRVQNKKILEKLSSLEKGTNWENFV